MPRIDFFNFFRWMLAVIVTVYATVITLQSLYGWLVYLSGDDKYMSLMRRYVILHGLRARLVRFAGDVLVCIGLAVVCGLIWRAHYVLSRIDNTLHENVRRLAKSR